MNKNSGNILFLILIAVSLFATLSYAITGSNRTTGNTIEKEKAKLSQAEIDSYTAALNQGKSRLTLINNCSNIDYTPPADQVSGDKTCHMFHPDGGGVPYRNLGLGLGCELLNMTIGENCNGLVYAGSYGGTRLYTTAADQGTYSWNNGSTNYPVTGLTSNATGLANTNALVALSDAGAPYNAAEACRALGTEWYLPAWGELTMLASNRLAIGGFNTGTYWSSTETPWDTDQARPQRFNGSPFGDPAFPKNTVISVRCVRQ